MRRYPVPAGIRAPFAKYSHAVEVSTADCPAMLFQRDQIAQLRPLMEDILPAGQCR